MPPSQSARRRRKLNWQKKDHDEQLRRLEHAYQHADIFIDTDELTPEAVLRKALDYLKERSFMKRLLASLLSLSLMLTSCSLFTPTATPHGNAQRLTRSKRRGRIVPSSKVDWSNSEQPVLDQLQGASVYHLEFKIADDIYHVTGTEEVRYTNTETAALNEVELRLFPNILGGEMTVTNLTVDAQSVTPSYGLENSLMIVPFSTSLEPNQSVILRMDFAVTVPQSVDLNYGVLAYAEDVLTLAHSYPMICVYDDEGWNAEIPPQSGDVTYADASFFIVRVTAPKGLTLVTTGQRSQPERRRTASDLGGRQRTGARFLSGGESELPGNIPDFRRGHHSQLCPERSERRRGIGVGGGLRAPSKITAKTMRLILTRNSTLFRHRLWRWASNIPA